MKIAIVNDMRMAVEVLRRIVSSVPGFQVAWVALDGADAVKKCSQNLPDLILMDLIMPVMDGVEATRQIMLNSPCAILVVTANVSVNSNKVYEAMGFGALDAVNTPVLDGGSKVEGAEALLAKIRTIGRLVSRPAKQEILRGNILPQSASAKGPPLVVIGASTGGPKVISTILAGLPANLPAAVVVIQHIDQVFAEGLAEWLQQHTPLKVRTAVAGKGPVASVVDVASTNDHLVLLDGTTFNYTRNPADLAYRPSVDVFFQSVAQMPPNSLIAVLLTGIGADGAQGMLKLRQAGHHTIAQNSETCVVFGMPKAAIDLKAACEVLPPERIIISVLAWIQRHENPKE